VRYKLASERGEMIFFDYNDTKATQDAAAFLKLNNGKMNYMKLIKLLYLADREALRQWGRPLTGDCYFSMKNGPILSNVLNNISHGKEPKMRSYWHEHISHPSSYNVSLKRDPGVDELSRRELDLIASIDKEYKPYDEWQMVDICHKILPEWEDPGRTSIPIRVEDILRVVHRTEREIAVIEEETTSIQYCDSIFPTSA